MMTYLNHEYSLYSSSDENTLLFLLLSSAITVRFTVLARRCRSLTRFTADDVFLSAPGDGGPTELPLEALLGASVLKPPLRLYR